MSTPKPETEREALTNARAALDAINDNANYGDGGIDNRVLESVEDALRALIAEHERITLARVVPVSDEAVERAARADFEFGKEVATWDQWIAADPDHADWCRRRARAVLEAAYREER